MRLEPNNNQEWLLYSDEGCQELLAIFPDKQDAERVKKLLEDPLESLRQAVAQNKDYAWTWFSNLVSTFKDAGCEDSVAREGAKRCMKDVLNVEILPRDNVCCFLGCSKPAEWRIGQSDEDATYACEGHRELLTCDGDNFISLTG